MESLALWLSSCCQERVERDNRSSASASSPSSLVSRIENNVLLLTFDVFCCQIELCNFFLSLFRISSIFFLSFLVSLLLVCSFFLCNITLSSSPLNRLVFSALFARSLSSSLLDISCNHHKYKYIRPSLMAIIRRRRRRQQLRQLSANYFSFHSSSFSSFFFCDANIDLLPLTYFINNIHHREGQSLVCW